jgi:NAD(P)-dependent dehydrogenase (short-subunit alcohol dehydrogenase family)
VGYSASKAGVAGLTLAMARGMAAEGIRINTILPGVMSTPILANVSQDLKDKIAAGIPFPNRLGTAAEYADLALFLIRNSYMNGENIRIDGAMRLPP